MIKRLHPKKLYALFLACDWWRDLSREKRARVGKCEKCGSKEHLQAHHVHYPENWFDTRLEHLRVLCRDCHEAEHHISRAKFTPNNRKVRGAWKQEFQQRIAARRRQSKFKP